MFSGIRILDLSDERGFLAGRILGDLGADVIKIEPPGAISKVGADPISPAGRIPSAACRGWLSTPASAG